MLPPMQQTPVNARISSGKPIDLSWIEVLESDQIKSKPTDFPQSRVLESDRIEEMPHVYSARCLISDRTMDVKVALLNTKKES